MSHTQPTTTTPTLVGHRGAAGLAPENTLPSFERALTLRVTTLELDVHLTRDHVPVVIHDERLDRTTDAKGYVRDWLAADLRGVNAAAGYPAHPPTPLPTLAEVLTTVGDRAGFFIELKGEEARAAELVRAVLETVDAAGARVRVRLISFYENLVAEARRQDGTIPLGALGARDWPLVVEAAKRYGCAAVMPHHGLLTPELIAEAHAEGFRVSAWTVNDPAALRRVVELGIDDLITDYPDRALAVLAGDQGV